MTQTLFESETAVIAEPKQTALAVVATNPLAVIQSAVEKGTDPDTMERLMAMYERHEAMTARQAYNSAMTEAQKEMPAVVRDKENSHLRTKYARLETVAAAIRPVYTKHGFALSFGTLSDAPADCVRIYCDCRHSAGHVDRIEGNFPLDNKGAGGSVNKTGIQAMGSTISYARRYLTLMIFNVSLSDEDNDGNGSGDCIDEKQLAELNSELLRIHSSERQNAVDALFKFAQITKLADLPKSKYQKAMSGLMRRSTEFPS